jgi:hypothetical protein
MTDAGTPRPHRAALVLVLGIVGLVCCLPAGIVAWVLGYQDRKAMQAGTMDPSGQGTTRAGEILGMIATLWFVLVAVFILLVLATGLAPRLYRHF